MPQPPYDPENPARSKKSMAELGRLSPADFKAQDKVPLSFILDDIRSANNVGSIFRTADGLGLAHVYLCGITATPPHRDILKTALGATSSVSWSYHEDCLALVGDLIGEDHLVFALEQTHHSVRLRDFDVPGPDCKLAIVLGNEVNGVNQTIIDNCDGAIEIEQFGTKHSFNVAVAAGMVGYQITRAYRTGQ